VYQRSDGNYLLKIPQYIGPIQNPSYMTIVQPISTAYRLVNIRGLQLRSGTIAVSGEYDAISQTPIIMSVDVTIDAAKDVYEYQSSSDNRFYDILSHGQLDVLNLSLFVIYNDGTIVQAYIPPYSSFRSLLKFVRKKGIVN
jgi:hypothetical protein